MADAPELTHADCHRLIKMMHLIELDAHLHDCRGYRVGALRHEIGFRMLGACRHVQAIRRPRRGVRLALLIQDIAILIQRQVEALDPHSERIDIGIQRLILDRAVVDEVFQIDLGEIPAQRNTGIE